MANPLFEKYQRRPHTFCPGCGIGSVMNCLFHAFDELDWNLEDSKIVGVSGIGCSALANIFLKTDVVHTAHGRALAVAQGIKLARPDLNALVISGDGDQVTIGGNHLIHFARRRIFFPVILLNNYLYGMTGGQVGATTPCGAKTSTTPRGNEEVPFDIVALVLAALKENPAPKLVSRYPLYPPRPLIASLKRVLTFEGFAFLEAITPCPIYYGRMNPPASASQMLLEQKKIYVSRERAKRMSKQELEGKIIFGDFSSLKEYIDALEGKPS